MKLITEPNGHQRWMHRWIEPDPPNKKPARHMALSRIIAEDDCAYLVMIDFVNELHQKHCFAFNQPRQL